MSKNCKHPHRKIRNEILKTIEAIFKCPGSGDNLQEIIDILKTMIVERSIEVRKKVYQVFYQCLLNFEFENLKKFENELILQLSTGLYDEDQELSQ